MENSNDKIFDPEELLYRATQKEQEKYWQKRTKEIVAWSEHDKHNHYPDLIKFITREETRTDDQPLRDILDLLKDTKDKKIAIAIVERAGKIADELLDKYKEKRDFRAILTVALDDTERIERQNAIDFYVPLINDLSRLQLLLFKHHHDKWSWTPKLLFSPMKEREALEIRMEHLTGYFNRIESIEKSLKKSFKYLRTTTNKKTALNNLRNIEVTAEDASGIMTNYWPEFDINKIKIAWNHFWNHYKSLKEYLESGGKWKPLNKYDLLVAPIWECDQCGDPALPGCETCSLCGKFLNEGKGGGASV